MTKRFSGQRFAARTAIVILGFLLPAGMAAAGSDKPDATALKERVPGIKGLIDDQYGQLETLYKHLHSHPELSLQEEHTAARLVQEVKAVGFEVTPKVGGHGLVAVLKNGEGPTVLVRTDMDALPVVEQTALPYASKLRARDLFGNDVCVMHARVHDMPMTFLGGTARELCG